MLSVEKHIQYFAALWDKCPTSLPVFNRNYSIEEQKERELRFELFQKKINDLQQKKNIQKIRKDPENSFFPLFKSFLETVFDFETEQLEIILADDFRNVSREFFDRAREFAPELKPDDIYQGMRNVWIMNGIQLMLNIPVEITPSIFAYSMIYPYSDNLLDDPAITAKEKQAFSDRFNRRLHGEIVEPKGPIEKQLFRLVEMFELQFDRAEFPDVYESLYAIQQGQTRSLSLAKDNSLTNNEIRSICFEKGGASVLADGFLVAGNLTFEQQQALFGYGVYLQLLDDIQDVTEDLKADTNTMFSGVEDRSMELLVNKTIHFGRKSLNELKCFEVENINSFLKLMNRSIEMMIVESVGLNHQWYSKAYLDEMNKVSPLRFEFIRQKKSESKSQRLALFQKYFDKVPAKEAQL
ncbi:MAG: hypothetical protein JXR61_12645 [Prolixibacteraceae bacterium]|nr:hypothetical protein [Prolixibacteraceae bacterium]